MNIFKTNDKDSVYWLKVVVRQAQNDIKDLKEEVKNLKKVNQESPANNKYVAENLDTVNVHIEGSK